MNETQAEALRTRIDRLVERGIKIRNASDADGFPDPSGFRIRLAGSTERTDAATRDEYTVNLRFYYEEWFSEARSIITQLLPDRIDEFLGLYQKKRAAQWGFDAYSISDYLAGVTFSNYKDSALRARFANLFETQLGILRSALTRIKPRLNDLYAEVAGGVYESMLLNARTLFDAQFIRPAAAIVGVVVESHLHDVCSKHKCLPAKKNPAISLYNDALKQASLLDQPTWRLIARIADIRNIAVHRTGTEPVKEDVEDIIRDAARILAAVF